MENKTLQGNEKIRKLIFSGIFAALTYIAFTFLSIHIPTPGGGQVTVHVGNAFVVLGSLMLGSLYGGLGYTEEVRIGRIWRDLRGNEFAGGAVEVMSYIAGREIVKKYKKN